MTVKNKVLQLSGGCYCGKVRYAVNGTPNVSYFCHCQQCRKLTGSAHASNMQIAPEAVTYIKGEEYVTKFICGSGRAFSNAFCQHCGSGLPFFGKSGEWVYVPVGGLDEVPDNLIDYNIFWDDKAKWYESGCAQPRCAAFPP